MTNLSDILNRPFTGYEPPKALPVGTYTAVVTALPEHKSSKNLNKYLSYKLRVVRAEGDVDEATLAEFGPIEGKIITVDFYYENDFGYSRLTNFLEACRAETEITMEEASQSIVGCQVLAHIKHKADQSGKGVRAEAVDFASV
jgi:hypothetical protein